MAYPNKRASISLSTEVIIILIIAIVFLGVGLGFIKGMFGKTLTTFEEQISKEPEPPAADANTPITLSREDIISNAGSNEVVKVNIFNPTSTDWSFRDAVTLEKALCGRQGDNICFIDIANPDCDSRGEDGDCKEYYCTQDSELGQGTGCVIVKGDDKLLCPPPGSPNYYENCNCNVDGYGIGYDPDCGPTAGVVLNIECSEGLKLEKITSPKEVKKGSSTEFSALLKIGADTGKGTYLCRVGIKGFSEELEKYSKDLTIRID